MLKNEKYTFEDLVGIMALLRSENGCPWDREQDHNSLKKYLIEETYEVLDAIDKEDEAGLCEELGDLLLQILFHSRISEQEGGFSIDDVIDGISKKMISRHTHVFGEDNAETADDVLEFWEANKKKEKDIKTQTDAIKSIPANLPALMRSYKVQQKAADVGFDWDTMDQVFDKVEEEIAELKDAYKNADMDEMEGELGDCLFALVNLARFMKVQPELALTGTIKRFTERFEYVEKMSEEKGKKLQDMTLAEMDALWDEAKKLQNENNEE